MKKSQTTTKYLDFPEIYLESHLMTSSTIQTLIIALLPLMEPPNHSRSTAKNLQITLILLSNTSPYHIIMPVIPTRYKVQDHECLKYRRTSMYSMAPPFPPEQ